MTTCNCASALSRQLDGKRDRLDARFKVDPHCRKHAPTRYTSVSKVAPPLTGAFLVASTARLFGGLATP
ncbi:hypothetical protein B0T26DRAFT_433250 [Lasiosphaeria miniovina]|uniref:Uncharacterized protein n=1 Tax=Lasiosphaeria miniovina TaxID=1954250 RepID=A0AA40A6H5_9PEZI|nr:uncharacterized protein B0T26DRAFT_433250 [Lasiosphaeria miniovina]KAK0710144.1 hypothetical protein B0T26DRAFT_433250 [Lasiosphaeria miniovina]